MQFPWVIIPALSATLLQTAAAMPAAEPEEPGTTPDGLFFRPPESDLLLSKEGELKAEALAHFVQGLLLEEGFRADEMLRSFRKTLDIDPGFIELAERVASEYIRRDELPLAVEVLKDAAKFAPDNARPHLMLAMIYLRDLRRPETALLHAQAGHRADPREPETHYTLFEVLLAMGQKNRALQVLAGAGELDVEEPDYWLRLGELYSRLLVDNQGNAPPVDLARINAVHEKAIALAGDKNPHVLNDAADFFMFTHQTARAIPLYMRILELDPVGADSLLTQVREKLARSLLASGERGEAIRLLEEMAAADPTRFETHEFLGQLHEENGDLVAALLNYEQSLLLNAYNPFVYFKAGEIAISLGEPGRAAKTLEQGRQLFPDLPAMTYALAVAYSRAKRFPLALAMFEHTLRDTAAEDKALIDSGFFFQYAAAAEQAGDYALAADLFQRSIEMDPANATAMNYLGYMWAERGIRIDEAEEWIRKALEIEPENGAYIDSLGWVYYQRGQYETALGHLLRALDHLDQPDPVVLGHVGDAYLQLGDNANAERYYRRSLQLAPDESIASKLEALRLPTASSP